MSWAVKYRTEFKDLSGIDWKIDIEEDGFGGSITDLIATDNPLSISYDNSSDDVYDPLQPSTASFSVYSETNFALIDLYSTEDFEFRVRIYQSTVLYWLGYVISNKYTEPYEQPPYPVTIQASCGLKELSDTLYKYQTTNPDDTYYNGRRRESQVIIDVLGKLGHTGFTEYVNLYEESMDDTVNDSPFDQIIIDVDVFKDRYCDEVLAEILKKYGARIIHKAGGFVIYRPVEIAEATVYGRVFTSATAKSSTSYTSTLYINRATNVSALDQIPGGVLMVQSPAKKVTAFQDYGYKESWIDNYDFAAESYDGTNFDFWTKDDAGSTVKHISELVPGETHGLAYKDNSTANLLTQRFGSLPVYSLTDYFVLEFEYGYYNTGTTSNPVTLLHIELESASLEEVDNNTLEWESISPNKIVFNENVPGSDDNQSWSGWKSYRKTFTTLPSTADLTISIGPPDDNDIYICYKNIKFYATSTTTLQKTIKRRFLQRIEGGAYGEFYIKDKYYTVSYKQADESQNVLENKYIKTNAINGKELEYNYTLGDVIDADIDNIASQFKGSLVYQLPNLAEVAAKFITDYAADYVAGGVTVTSDEEDIVFTSSTPGTDFTGSTTVSNATGDLDGTVVTTQANVTALYEIDTITLSGSAGTANLSCNGVTKLATFNTTLSITASDFVLAWAADFLAAGVTINEDNDKVVFISAAGVPFTSGAAIANVSGDLNGTKVNTQDSRVAVARIDTVTLTGSWGVAGITCDAVGRQITFAASSTTDWNTRGGSESKPLLEIITDEIAAQYSRPKQLVQLVLFQNDNNVSAVNIIGHYEDDLNLVTSGGSVRKFIINRATLDVKAKTWVIDLIEII